MSINSNHHIHLPFRKKKKQPLIDKIVYIAVIFGPVMTLPQLYIIWVENGTNVSLVSWISYLIIAAIWLAYGIKHKATPIIAVQCLWITVDLLVVVGLLR